jgi:hypothetical protein
MRLFSVSVRKESIDLADVTFTSFGSRPKLVGNYRFSLDARRAKPRAHVVNRVVRWVNNVGGNAVNVIVPFDAMTSPLGRKLIRGLRENTIASSLRLVEGETQNDRIKAYLRMVREFIPH